MVLMPKQFCPEGIWQCLENRGIYERGLATVIDVLLPSFLQCMNSLCHKELSGPQRTEIQCAYYTAVGLGEIQLWNWMARGLVKSSEGKPEKGI